MDSRRTASLLAAAFSLLLLFHALGEACTNFLVSKGASKDGSVLITYAADSHVLYGELYYTPAGHHQPGTMLRIYEWDTGRYLGMIDQVEWTYTVVGNMNEYQVAIGETTYGGRAECRDETAIIDYGSLMFLALQRAKTAREAIAVMAGLVEKYGYYSLGESFSVSDPNEAWIFEMIGKDPKDKGAVWVARRVPEGYVCAHANQARITTFPLADGVTSITSEQLDRIHDPRIETVYAADVISYARAKGWFEGEDAAFSFADTYAPLEFGGLRFCEARVWCFFHRVAPSLNLPWAYAAGDPKAERMPLFVKPDRKLSVHDLMECMRDHYEGTPFDMTKDIGAGPFKLPYRWRPLTWELDGKTYFNERATATQQTGFSFVAQSRSWLPDPIGGVFWFGVDDAASCVYVPMYCAITKVPASYAVGTGDFHHFSWDAAFWVFNWVANYAYSRYCDMIQDIQIVQRELEGRFLADQPRIEALALQLYQESPRKAVDYLTSYSVDQGNQVVARWRKLGQDLLVKYMDGNVKDELGKVTHQRYPETWYRAIVEDTGDRLEVKGGETGH